MNIENLKELGLPVLRAQLALHSLASIKAIKAAQNLVSLRLVYTTTGPLESLETIQTIYIDENQVPEEFIEAFQKLANRLLAEKWILEDAIGDLEQQEKLLGLFNQ